MVNFIDFRKAFDCIHRPSLWSILRQYGIPEEIVNIIQNLFKDSKSNVKINGISGEWFEVVTGVRQGYVLSPLLFAIVLDWVMKKSLKNHNVGLAWADGKKLCDLDFAYDIALIETSQKGMQKLSEEVETMSGYVGLHMNAAKCKVLVSECWADPTAVMAEGAEVEVVEDFCYLGSYISKNGNCNKECSTRIGKASSVFGRLKNIWSNKNMSGNKSQT